MKISIKQLMTRLKKIGIVKLWQLKKIGLKELLKNQDL